jgi:hypothetical protein
MHNSRLHSGEQLLVEGPEVGRGATALAHPQHLLNYLFYLKNDHF